MPGWVWAERRWLPFVSYEHDKDGHLIFNLGKDREIVLPENVTIKEGLNGNKDQGAANG